MPRDGEYIAEYVPDRIREPQRHVLAVMASQALRADAALDVTPPPIRVVAAARVGLFYNFGHATGPAFFLEALRPLALLPFQLQLGGTVGYLSTAVTGSGPEAGTSARLEIDQVPVLALARARLPFATRFELSGDLVAGMMIASTHLNTASGGLGFDADGSAHAPAFGGGAEAALTLKPGRLVFGLRYLWSRLGRTSQGDEIKGNSAGLIGDIGYRMTF
jgi:hypothetical protein